MKNCPRCGRFLSYDAYYGRWRCSGERPPCEYIQPKQPDKPLPKGWKNEGIGKVLLRPSRA